MGVVWGRGGRGRGGGATVGGGGTRGGGDEGLGVVEPATKGRYQWYQWGRRWHQWHGDLAGHGGTDASADASRVDAGSADVDARPATGVLAFQDPPGRNLDMLFMVDNSQSMMPLQTKLTQRLPDFMNVLKNLPGGLPNLHVAVISSSLGAGRYGNVPGCAQGTTGNEGGAFQHSVGCTGLHAGQHFISSVAGVNNFDGDISTVFSCIALLGDTGCGFEHQFASTIAALQKASDSNDLDNAGFLRPDASLAIVMLTNEDDCSTPPDFSSSLFDPGVESISDASGLGGLQSYRCNEFGHLCDGVAPPHTLTGQVTLNNCTSAEGMSPGPGGSTPDPLHQLIRVSDFVDFLKGLKADPTKVLVAALAGPPAPYVVEPHTFQLGSGGTEVQPWIVHSCTAGAAGTEHADPGVRIKNWLDAFGPNGILESICDADFGPALTAIANAIVRTTGTNCVGGPVLPKADGTPNCTVVQATPSATGTSTAVALSLCDATRSVVPCWQFRQDVVCGSGQRLDVCHDVACAPVASQTSSNIINVSCSFAP